LQAALEQERMRADVAARETANVKDEYRSLREQLDRDRSSTAAIFARLQEALDQEKWRGDAVARQLTATLDEVRILRSFEDSRLAPMMLQLEGLGVRGPIRPDDENRLALAQPMITGAIAAGASLEQARAEAQATPQVGNVQSAEPQARAEVAPIAPSTDDRLVIRGEALFRQGDVSGARLLLQRAYESGNSRATFILAETFDPHVLSERGVIGIRSDAARARELYSQALALNVEQASARLEALR
jgi:hypothetical protein